MWTDGKSGFVSIKEHWLSVEIMMIQLQIVTQETDCILNTLLT